MLVAQSWEDSNNHGLVYRKWGRCMVCELYLNKAVLGQRKWETLVEEGHGSTVMFEASEESAGVVPKLASITCACNSAIYILHKHRGGLYVNEVSASTGPLKGRFLLGGGC